MGITRGRCLRRAEVVAEGLARLEEEKIEVIKGAAIAAPFVFEDAYLPFFLVGFAVFFVAFFAMPGSCGLVSSGCADADAYVSSLVGIGASRVRVKMNREFTEKNGARCRDKCTLV